MVPLPQPAIKADQPIAWSPQQQAFLDWCEKGSGSCVLEAVAGAGKTTTLIEGAKRISGQVAITAFNKKIADEIKAKLVKAGMDWKKAQGGTAHSFGFSAYRKAHPNVRVDEYKIRNMVDVLLPLGHKYAIYKSAIQQLVSLARQCALGVVGKPINDLHTWLEMAEHYDVFDEDESPIPVEEKAEVIGLAQGVLRQSIDTLDVIDFDDMIYMPLYHRVRFWQFDVVMVDEAQDTNAARRALVRAMVKRGGRVVAVGDRHQAIYGFTGADADALDLIAKDFNCIDLPLTVSYRCPQLVVKFAQRWVSHIQAADTAPEGAVSDVKMEDFLKRNDLNGDASVLSRTNKPLVSLAFRLIRQRTPCRIEGRDVANRIKKLIQRWKVKSLDALETKLEAYLARETTKLLAAKKESKLAEIEDAVETVRIIVDQCRLEKKNNVKDAVDYVDSMFGDNVSGVLTLSSIHKAKGREWERVFWLDRAGTCPNKWARQAWQQQQEKNLMYVAATRAKSELIELAPDPKKLS
jgi:superfamily I DNA/RNA helicase